MFEDSGVVYIRVSPKQFEELANTVFAITAESRPVGYSRARYVMRNELRASGGAAREIAMHIYFSDGNTLVITQGRGDADTDIFEQAQTLLLTGADTPKR